MGGQRADGRRKGERRHGSATAGPRPRATMDPSVIRSVVLSPPHTHVDAGPAQLREACSLSSWRHAVDQRETGGWRRRARQRTGQPTTTGWNPRPGCGIYLGPMGPCRVRVQRPGQQLLPAELPGPRSSSIWRTQTSRLAWVKVTPNDEEHGVYGVQLPHQPRAPHVDRWP